jgi:small multidrug resistance pump
MPPLVILAIAILAETIATTAMKAAEGFTRLVPSIIVVIGYATSFYCLSLTLKVFPVGIVYAIWSGVGIVLITLMGWLIYGQKMDLPALAGMGLIVAGVLVINLLSATTAGGSS